MIIDLFFFVIYRLKWVGYMVTSKIEPPEDY